MGGHIGRGGEREREMRAGQAHLHLVLAAAQRGQGGAGGVARTAREARRHGRGSSTSSTRPCSPATTTRSRLLYRRPSDLFPSQRHSSPRHYSSVRPPGSRDTARECGSFRGQGARKRGSWRCREDAGTCGQVRKSSGEKIWAGGARLFRETQVSYVGCKETILAHS